MIAVAGGTGVVGTYVVDEVRRRGHQARVVSRSHGVDLATGAGLDSALQGADAVIDVSNVSTNSGRKAVAFFEAATGNLLAAGERAGIRHHVALSIVGIDRVDLPYYRGKVRQEDLVEAGRVPWTIVRATQFHEFPGQLIDRSPRPLALAPAMLSRPVAASEVAAVLVDAALGEPQGRTRDVAGPDQLLMSDLVRRVLAKRGERRLVVPLPLPGRMGRAVRAGGLLPQGEAVVGTQTWDDWLDRSA
ncbi:SDR family oxidoreductase [Nocardioides panacisoli]|uniref:NAD(P)H-binding protein n=1 Tax=Nocardioides panacisoli TaxID=627624 RepID=A0ABP7IRX3_9ACTN